MQYSIINPKNTAEQYDIKANDITEVRHWIINHLDISKQWSVVFVESLTATN